MCKRFLSILFLWVTDRYHGISPTAVAFVGAIVALIPKIGIVSWNDVDIPWHLLLFSAGAYTLGAGFNITDLPSIAVNSMFDSLGISDNTPFWVLYLILTFGMDFSALLFQSKTMRAMIFIPIFCKLKKIVHFFPLSLKDFHVKPLCDKAAYYII